MAKHIGQEAAGLFYSVGVTESPIETILFEEFMRSKLFTLIKDGDEPQGEGMFLYPQKEMPPYRPDFYIEAIGYGLSPKVWPPKFKTALIIECDGKEFHSSEEQIQKDAARDKFFAEKNIKTMRYGGAEIYQASGQIVHGIYNELLRRLNAGAKYEPVV